MNRDMTPEEINASVERHEKQRADLAAAELAAEKKFAAQIQGIREQRAAVASRGPSAAEQEKMLADAKPAGMVRVNYDVDQATMNRVTDLDVIMRAIASAEADGNHSLASAWKAHMMRVQFDVDSTIAAQPDHPSMRVMERAKELSVQQMQAAVAKKQTPGAGMSDDEFAAGSAAKAEQLARMMRGGQ